MPCTTCSPETAKLLDYLRRCGGRDVTECLDDRGDPDPLAARRVAEALRSRLGHDLDLHVSVAQSANRVTVSVLG
jgi:hypothetical protein